MNLDRNLILLFGMPRSGTTWIGKVIDSHPDVVYMHEPDSVNRMDRFLPLFPDIGKVEQYEAVIGDYLENILSLCSVRVSGKLPLFKKRGQSGTGYLVQRVTMLVRRSLDRVLNRELTWASNINNANSRRYAWKSIESTGRLGVILRTRPDSKGVLILRHPCGYISSVLRGQKGGAFAAGTNAESDWGYYKILLDNQVSKKYRLNLEKLKAMSPEERLAWRWVLVNEKALEDITGLENGVVVHYEDFCNNPMEEYAKIFKFLGLSWNDQTKSFLSASIQGGRSGYYSVYKNPISSANKWKEELDGSVADRIIEIAKQSSIGCLYFS